VPDRAKVPKDGCPAPPRTEMTLAWIFLLDLCAPWYLTTQPPVEPFVKPELA
jgi:hypothetical protein